MLESFHPAVAAWFRSSFAAPTECQLQAWPIIQRQSPVLIAAPTGSGKTLAAFLCAIDDLVGRAQAGELDERPQVLYVSPLKALSNDIHRNLDVPLAGIRDELLARGDDPVEIRTFVRTGDTPQAKRAAMRRIPPHIIVTTPESLYILLTSDSGRQLLKSIRTVIVDEIHAIADSKRGSHLALTLERLTALTEQAPVRIGLSATQKPIDEMARFLVGGQGPAEVVDTGHVRARDLAIELPASPLEPVMSGEVWQEIYAQLIELIRAHRTTLIFVNTRRMAERLAHHLSEQLGDEDVTSHHGSLSREKRLDAEQRLKAGRLRALVATASLELGIDIGDVDLVCQIGTTRSITTFLQRVGRSGHGVGRLPKGRLFPLSRDELVESVALLDAIRRGELDKLHIPRNVLDVMAQQIVAAVACEDWLEDELFELIRRAYPYRDIERQVFDQVVRMLAEGFSTRRGRGAAYLHRDAVNKRLRARRGAKLTAVTCGGAIPDLASYEVRLEPNNAFVGTLDEDFAIESLPGDIFQLGNTSWRILRVEAGTVRVADAHGQPPNIPFWMGEAPARTMELSAAVSRLREEVEARLTNGSQDALRWLTDEVGVAEPAARQAVDYLAIAGAPFGALPTHNTLIMERFFDESGGMQLVIHSPFGGRVNRAWGLALRKRFCRQFNFELQAAATEDAIVLSLGETHSFPLDEIWHYLKPESVRDVLTQALLDAPMFTARWRWNATCALALRRFHGGKKVPARLQRMYSEDLIAVVFPEQLACAENFTGRREIPDHPLVNQTVDDCLTEAMDVDFLKDLLADIGAGNKRLIAKDLTEPSPLAYEVLTARPYAFLDDAPLEERRTQAVMSRRWLDPQTATDIGKLDPAAIERVRTEAWPDAGNADELHDALCVLGFLTQSEGGVGGVDADEDTRITWVDYFTALCDAGRATVLSLDAGVRLWVATERVPQLTAVHRDAALSPEVVVPAEFLTQTWEREDALRDLIRGRLEGVGPTTACVLAEQFRVPLADVDAALNTLEGQGAVLRGNFTGGTEGIEWCDRRLLARIHRYTVKRLRAEIEPVSAADFLRFLFRWQHVAPGDRLEGPRALEIIVEQLQGFEIQAAAWEGDVLPNRVKDYEPGYLDDLCLSGRAIWMRRSVRRNIGNADRAMTPVRSTPITLLTRGALPTWQGLEKDATTETGTLSADSGKILAFINVHGASFFDDFADGTGLLASQIEQALGELVARGLVRSDSFRGLRALLVPSNRRKPMNGGRRGRRRRATFGVADAGRWVAMANQDGRTDGDAVVDDVAWTLLHRYGVVFRRLLEREGALPPWRDLLRVFHILEARGEIRGGRFVAGFSGEQFALPDAVTELRAQRRITATGDLVSVSAADPLNLVGVLTPGARVPALSTNRVLYRDGEPIAVQLGKEVRLLVDMPAADAWQAKNVLVRRRVPPELKVYLGGR